MTPQLIWQLGKNSSSSPYDTKDSFNESQNILKTLKCNGVNLFMQRDPLFYVEHSSSVFPLLKVTRKQEDFTIYKQKLTGSTQ